jgi:uncharacterized protein (DUF58 family)
MPEKTIDKSQIEAFGSLEFIAKQVVEGFITGLHKSPLHGFSVEFAEHKLYNPGESIKHIDWKLFGRTEKLFTKKYEEETNLRCQIVIDNSSSMYFPFNETKKDKPNKIIFSVYSAAAIMQMLKRQRDAVGVTLYSENIEEQTQCKSTTTHHKLIYSILEKTLIPIPIETKKKTSTAKALHQIAESIHKRSLIIIFSDMFENIGQKEEMFQSLQHLKHNKHEVILFHVVDKKKEIDFEYENRPYKFIDSEDGKELKINPSEVKENYIKSIKIFENELKMKCAQYKIDFVEADINQGFYQILYPYLLKRQKLN